MSYPLVADQAEIDSGSTKPRASRGAWTPLARALEATGDHWTLAIVLALAPGTTRLTHLRERLPGISTGVLARGLSHMVGLGLVTRTRFKEKPPRVELELTDAGRELIPIAEALARWGMRHTDALTGSSTGVWHNGGRGQQRRDPQGA
jgi:DNA-binding HxlR family transcriptional regulator